MNQTELTQILVEIRIACREVLALAEKATPEPWNRIDEQTVFGVQLEITINSSHYEQDSSFIARSRALTPFLAQSMLTTLDALEQTFVSAETVDRYARETAKTALLSIATTWKKGEV